jgi:hypothetical protein
MHKLDSNVLLPVIQSITQEKSEGKSISESIVDIAIQQASGGGKNVNEVLRQAAEIISKQAPGVPFHTHSTSVRSGELVP